MLRFEGINAHIQGARVLRDLNVSVPLGSTVNVIGRNGAGKTSMLRTVMGLLTPTTGRIYQGEIVLSEMPPHKRPGLGIGYAPEDRRLFSEFTVEENLVLPAQVANLDGAEVRNRLEQVYEIIPELRELKNRSAGAVSGGQGKMVALGRALMIGTKLVLLDEPFQGLAPALAHRYADALRTIREKKRETTLVITESNPELLQNFGDVVYRIERGEVTLEEDRSGNARQTTRPTPHENV